MNSPLNSSHLNDFVRLSIPLCSFSRLKSLQNKSQTRTFSERSPQGGWCNNLIPNDKTGSQNICNRFTISLHIVKSSNLIEQLFSAGPASFFFSKSLISSLQCSRS